MGGLSMTPDQMRKIERVVIIAEGTAASISAIAQIFDRNLRDNPYPSERAFTGVINQARIEVEQEFPETAQKSIETRKIETQREVLTEDEVS